MWQWLTQIDGLQQIHDVGIALRAGWPIAAVVLAVGLAVALGFWLYSGYATVAPRLRWLLAVLRAGLVGLIVLLLFEPALKLDASITRRVNLLVLIDQSKSMTLRDARLAAEDVRRAAIAKGLMPLEEPDADVSLRVRQQIDSPARIELSTALLGPDGASLLERLQRDYKVQLYGFATQPAVVEAADLAALASPADASSGRTALGDALDQVAQRHAGQPMAGIIVLTDGAQNHGRDPIAVARRIGQRDVRVFPVGIGLGEPDDVAVRQVVLQEVVFPGDRVPVQVTLRADGFAGRPAVVKLLLDDREVASRAVNLKGGTQFEAFEFIPQDQDIGTRRLRVSVSALAGETTIENNQADRSVLVTDRRIRVLYVEGRPRWEYRYLRRVLQRDRRLEVKYVMTQGDPQLAANADEHLAAFPTEADEAFAFDLLIIGDVPASTFNDEQFARIEELVGQQGGSMLMLAGRQFAPVGYRGTVIEKMLPVRLGDARKPWLSVGPNMHPALTVAGRRAGAMGLTDDGVDDHLVWRRVAPMDRIANLGKAKPGAVTWLTLSKRHQGEPYPLVAWHRFGSGRCLYVGTDALWRMRYRVGPKYHERFWSQSIQFMALSRLLAGRDRIRIETDQREYTQGEPVQVFATVQDESWQPLRAAEYDVVVRASDAAGPTRRVTLTASPDRPGVFTGTLTDVTEGSYVLQPAGQTESPSQAQFIVRSADLEMREPALQEERLSRMADASGGMYVRLDGLQQMLNALETDQLQTRRAVMMPLWDLPVTYVLIVLVAGLEWFLRRRSSLP
jgi:hypothetical protein